MPSSVLVGLIIPFLGTSAGAAMVFALRSRLSDTLERALEGFAAGVMVAASVWSLLIPAIEAASDLGRLATLPAVVGFWLGTLLLLLLDHLIPHLHVGEDEPEGPHTKLRRTTLMVLAVTLHNIPEGIAVGVVFASWMAGATSITFAGALALAIGIAIQNFPEGAIISLPLAQEGASRTRAFLGGVASGVVEPVASVLTIVFASQLVPLLSYLLGAAAGAMVYVVVEELVPEMAKGEHSHVGPLMFAAGFTLMMALDTMLG
jgi:ZIP family zinc transporter